MLVKISQMFSLVNHTWPRR